MHRDEYKDIYKLDMHDEWINTAYDESGDTVLCDVCSSELKWDRKRILWCCPKCGREMDRPAFFNYIGANPPGYDCITNCRENYPFCKKTCEVYLIDPDDPILR